MTPDERAVKREAVVRGLVAKGYTRDRAEKILSGVSRALFGPNGPLATQERGPHG